MTYTEYDRWTEAQLKGRKVVSGMELKNGSASLPAGTVYTIEKKFKGFSLVSDPCPCCGVRHYITRVKPHAVTLLQEEQA